MERLPTCPTVYLWDWLVTAPVLNVVSMNSVPVCIIHEDTRNF